MFYLYNFVLFQVLFVFKATAEILKYFIGAIRVFVLLQTEPNYACLHSDQNRARMALVFRWTLTVLFIYI